MTELKKLTYEDSDVDLLRLLNEEAFPKNERISVEFMFRSFQGLQNDVLGIYEDNRFAGFFMMLVDEYCAYINYFAVCPEMRSKGTGSRALALLHRRYAEKMIVVDFEAADETAENNALRKRRRAFYLRNGFYPTGYYQFYMQTEFEICSNRESYDRPVYEALIATISKTVWSFHPVHYRKDS